MGGLVASIPTCWNVLLVRSAGGGKCPEEEHTTCSGGPTNYNLSQARFMGRGIILFYKIRFYKIKCKI
jgi:hypothetical protein